MIQRCAIAQRNCLRYAFVTISMTRFRRSFNPPRKKMLANTGTMKMENVIAPSSANATVHAMGRKSRPSMRCSVKIGR